MNQVKADSTVAEEISLQELKEEVQNDYKIALQSREASLMGRREVLTGKAKFGIFGDGKEIAQLALAKQFQNGDFRSGYYRDQTIMMALGALPIEDFFAQLYADPDVNNDPSSAGRQMNAHFATRSLDDSGNWKNLMEMKNSAADSSPTASQMPRLLGLAYASKFYRENENLHHKIEFSNKGNEVAFGTIGDASTSEGHFWETINAAGVLQVPMVVSVWDDGHGISVPKKYQTTKESISEVLRGFQRNNNYKGYEIFKVKGWDYANLCLTYEEAVKLAREQHIPVLVHVEECTQPQGHSTSGSHERYKSKERLAWEAEFDGIVKLKAFMLEKELATAEELEKIENDAKKLVRDAKKKAWDNFLNPIKKEIAEVSSLLLAASITSPNKVFIEKELEVLKNSQDPLRREVYVAARKGLRYLRDETSAEKTQLINWLKSKEIENKEKFNSHLHSQSELNALNVKAEPAQYQGEEKLVDGREIIRDNFDVILERHPEVIIFGEDSGKIGGVNQGLEGLQAKYGVNRVFDTGIRETTIIGQGYGMAMRGLRPIAEIQYLDYLLYALQTLSDDVSTLQYRTKGGQKAPLIVRTRGHRLEGIWHSGSPMGMIINTLRGMVVCTPRNMTQAAGFYNTLLASDEPALVIESLNGYRLKEKLPTNLGDFKVPVGVVETMKTGTDITVVCYGSMVRMVEESAKQLIQLGVNIEIIDVQTLLPFDIEHNIVKSLQKTNRILFVDEDINGGATAFMMQQVLEKQGGYKYLDSAPKTLTAKNHRPAYGSDGDYFSKPSVEDIVETAYEIMHEFNPTKYPSLY
jgi:pyruvate/2-oxoglutarate/acetoin dehydrogenase E1 component/TPP-dependent pyruvate/acetoin dehydrogenase alpha subunit